MDKNKAFRLVISIFVCLVFVLILYAIATKKAHGAEFKVDVCEPIALTGHLRDVWMDDKKDAIYVMMT